MTILPPKAGRRASGERSASLAAGLTTIEALLARRAAALAEIEAVDAELARLGLRSTRRPADHTRLMATKVLAALAGGPLTPREVASKTGQTDHAATQALCKMVAAGELRRAGRGLYALTGTA